MKKLTWINFLAVALAAAAPASAGRGLLAFREGVPAARRSAVVAGLGASVVEEVPELGLASVEPAGAMEDFLARARALPEVEEAREDVALAWTAQAPALGMPFPGMEELRALLPGLGARPGAPAGETPRQLPLPRDVSSAEVPWGVARVNAPAAWAVAEGEGVKVAVIDTGIDCSHPDLAPNCAGGVNMFDPSSSYHDDGEHGTRMAGVIAAARDGRGDVGVAPRARLYAVKALHANGQAELMVLVRALRWAADNGMDVANLSLAVDSDPLALRRAVRDAVQRGVTLIAATGNSLPAARVRYPAAYEDVIAVAASDARDGLGSFSGRGPQVDFIAPGVAIRTPSMGGGQAVDDGTSQAAAHVAGLAALAISRGARRPAEVRAALRAAAGPLAGLHADGQGLGLVDAARLVGLEGPGRR